MYRSCLALLILLFVPSLCHSWPAQVVSVSDGDTLTVLHDGRQEKIRLFGVDSPEKDQEFGQKAKEIAKALTAGRIVDVTTMAKDHYGRTVGLVSVDAQSLSDLLIQNGFAWVYRQYCKERFCSELARFGRKSTAAKKGTVGGIQYYAAVGMAASANDSKEVDRWCSDQFKARYRNWEPSERSWRVQV